MKRNIKFILPIVLFALGLLIIICGLLLMLADFPVQMPSLVGEDGAASIERLEKMGFVASVDYSYEADKTDGVILEQGIEAGTPVSVGTAVPLLINSAQNSALIEVPNLKGMPEAESVERLTGLGLIVSAINYKYSAEAEEGTVLCQSVEAYSGLRENSELSLTVCTKEYGKANVMHSLIGSNWESSVKCLFDMGLKFTLTLQSDEQSEPWAVLEQNITDGMDINLDKEMLLTICGEASRWLPDDRDLKSLFGKSLTDAVRKILVWGCDVSVKYENDPYAEIGAVIDWNTYPSHGGGHNIVELIICNGNTAPLTEPEPEQTPEPDDESTAPDDESTAPDNESTVPNEEAEPAQEPDADGENRPPMPTPDNSEHEQAPPPHNYDPRGEHHGDYSNDNIT